MICPLMKGCYYVPDGSFPLATYLGSCYREDERVVKIVCNANMEAKVSAGERCIVDSKSNAFSVPDGCRYDGIVEEHYRGGVPPGCYFRLVVRDDNLIHNRLDQLEKRVAELEAKVQ